MAKTDSPIVVNGRAYPRPHEPIVVVCIDGSEPQYHELAIKDSLMPWAEHVRDHGTYLEAQCVIPALTNVNNMSIATGVTPDKHGITGNYFFDDSAGEEVLMNDPKYLRVPTILSAFQDAGHRVAVVTAKDKLRRLLGKDLDAGICFSAEKATQTSLDVNGIEAVLDMVDKPQPSIYSAELSEFVLAAGAALLRQGDVSVMYLTLTDYIQHKHAPGTPVANDFYAMLDNYFAKLHETGATVVVTSDHGMSPKSTPDGKPNVVYLGQELSKHFRPGDFRVVLPITDPYTVHHGALGSFAMVHLKDGVDASTASACLAELRGVSRVMSREQACQEYSLAPDRVGDLVVL